MKNLKIFAPFLILLAFFAYSLSAEMTQSFPNGAVTRDGRNTAPSNFRSNIDVYSKSESRIYTDTLATASALDLSNHASTGSTHNSTKLASEAYVDSAVSSGQFWQGDTDGTYLATSSEPIESRKTGLAHGMTALGNTDAYMHIDIGDGTKGGLWLRALSGDTLGGDDYTLHLAGISVDTSPSVYTMVFSIGRKATTTWSGYSGTVPGFAWRNGSAEVMELNSAGLLQVYGIASAETSFVEAGTTLSAKYAALAGNVAQDFSASKVGIATTTKNAALTICGSSVDFLGGIHLTEYGLLNTWGTVVSGSELYLGYTTNPSLATNFGAVSKYAANGNLDHYGNASFSGDVRAAGSIYEAGTALSSKYAALAGNSAQDFSAKNLDVYGPASMGSTLVVSMTSDGYYNALTLVNRSAGTNAVNRIQLGNDASDGSGQIVLYGSQHAKANQMDINQANNTYLNFLTNNLLRFSISGAGTASFSSDLYVAGNVTAGGFVASDSSSGISATLELATCTMTFKNGLLTALTGK